jgi:hypothetical protein
MVIAKLFITFTRQIWLMLRDEFRYPDWKEISTLNDAVETWSVSQVVHRLRRPKMIPLTTGLVEDIPGWKLDGFREKFHSFFPLPEEGRPPRGSQWLNYIKEYYETIVEHGFVVEEMETLFSRIQCLPVSTKFTKVSRGNVWLKDTK